MYSRFPTKNSFVVIPELILPSISNWYSVAFSTASHTNGISVGVIWSSNVAKPVGAVKVSVSWLPAKSCLFSNPLTVTSIAFLFTSVFSIFTYNFGVDVISTLANSLPSVAYLFKLGVSS